MAEPLKNHFGRDAPGRVVDLLADAYPDLDREAFVNECLDGYDQLELTPRARRISDVMADHLPADRAVALALVTESIRHGDPSTDTEMPGGMEGFVYLPLAFFIADHGLDHFEAAMTAQYELTRRFTAEASIRPYLEHHQQATLDRLRVWASDPDVHVRRLVSEGTRPRLPWAPALRDFQRDPTPVIELLELLKDDSEEYVRRSVANNLNDISKDHPDVAVAVAARWWPDGDRNRRRLIRHGLRTLIKKGDPAALAILGYGRESPVGVAAVTITPDEVRIGERVRIEVELENPTDEDLAALVDLRIHFVKKSGSTSPKVFKGAEVEIPPRGVVAVRKTVSVAQLSTRTHHPGRHDVEVLVNGRVEPAGHFDLA